MAQETLAIAIASMPAIERASRHQPFLGCNLLYWMATAA
jgi:hypothetical protein